MINPFRRRKPEPEARSYGGYGTLAGTPIGAGGWPTMAQSPWQQENLAAIQACIAAISSAVSSMPVRVYRTVNGHRVEVPDHPVARLLRRPSPNTTLPNLVEFWIAQTLGWGNGLLAIDYDSGTPIELTACPWANVNPIVLPSGRIAFDVNMFGLTGAPRRLVQGEVLWLRDRTDSGVIGRARLSRVPAVMDSAIGVQEHSGGLWRHYASPSGAIKVPTSLQEAQYQRLRASLDAKATGTHNAGKLLILDNGAEFQPFSVAPEQMETLASRRFSTEEICRIFQVPGPIAGDLQFGSFQNSETMGRFFLTHCIRPWIVKVEAEMNAALFPGDDSYSVDFDMSTLSRPDDAARWAAYQIAVTIGVLDPAEIRVLEGWNPRPDTAADGPGDPDAAADPPGD